MEEMIKELEGKLKEVMAQKKDWEAKEKFWTEAVNTAKKELKVLNEDIENLEIMIEAAKGLRTVKCDGKAKKSPIVKTKEEEIDPKHKKAMVLQINQYDTVTNRWKTQREAAKELETDQSTICKFMKMSKDVQIQKKGFALIWQY